MPLIYDDVTKRTVSLQISDYVILFIKGGWRVGKSNRPLPFVNQDPMANRVNISGRNQFIVLSDHCQSYIFIYFFVSFIRLSGGLFGHGLLYLKKKKKKKKFCSQYFCLWKVRKLQSLWCHHGHTAHTCSFYCKDWKLVPGLFMILIKQQDIVICWFFVDDGYYFWVSHCTPSKKVKTLHSS